MLFRNNHCTSIIRLLRKESNNKKINSDTLLSEIDIDSFGWLHFIALVEVKYKCSLSLGTFNIFDFNTVSELAKGIESEILDLH